MSKSKYKVTAATGYLGHKQGEEFEAELTPEQERRAKQRGSIQAVKQQEAKAKQEGSKDG